MGKMSVLSLLVCTVAAMNVAGCGSSSMSLGTVQPALHVEARPQATGIRIVVDEFQDVRKEMQGRCVGEAKTGFFNSVAEVTAADPATAIVAAAIRDGVTKAGFTVVQPGEEDFRIAGQLEQFKVEEHATGFSLEYSKAYVRYNLFVRDSAGKTVWGSTIDKYESTENVWDATEHDLKTLTKAVQVSVEAIFQDESFWKAVSK